MGPAPHRPRPDKGAPWPPDSSRQALDRQTDLRKYSPQNSWCHVFLRPRRDRGGGWRRRQGEGPEHPPAHSRVPPTLNWLTMSSSGNQASSTRWWWSSSIGPGPGQPQLVDVAHPKVLFVHSHGTSLLEQMCLFSQIRGQHVPSLPIAAAQPVQHSLG